MVLGLNLSSCSELWRSFLLFLERSGRRQGRRRSRIVFIGLTSSFGSSTRAAIGGGGAGLSIRGFRTSCAGPGLKEGDDEIAVYLIHRIENGLFEIEDHPGDSPGIGRLELAQPGPCRHLVWRPDRLSSVWRTCRIEQVDDEAEGIVQGEDLGNGPRRSAWP